MQFYMKTGRCKFGVTCKFNHPRDIQIQLSEEQIAALDQTQFTAKIDWATVDTQYSDPLYSSMFQNSKGLPIRVVLIYLGIESLVVK